MSIDPDDIHLETQPAGGRYVYTFSDGAVAEMTFSERPPGVMTITHTATPMQHRGKGAAAALVDKAIRDFRLAGHKVVPACSYARDQFERYPGWRDLLYQPGA